MEWSHSQIKSTAAFPLKHGTEYWDKFTGKLEHGVVEQYAFFTFKWNGGKDFSTVILLLISQNMGFLCSTAFHQNME
jgi:hypothetical protein